MKKIAILLIVILLLVLTACDTTTSLSSYPKVISTETINASAMVISYNESHWYAANAHNYKFSVYVECEEYGISKTFKDQTRGMWATSELKGLKKGDVVQVVVVKKTYDNNHTTMEITDLIR